MGNLSTRETSKEDVVRAAEYLKASSSIDTFVGIGESLLGGLGLVDTGSGIDSRHVGSRFNEWRKPVTEFGRNNASWEKNLKSSPKFDCMDFNRKEWARSRDTVDKILDMLLTDLLAYSENIDGLKIERYVRQGSSRDGLKVIAADEFDTLLLYHFEGFSFETIPVFSDSKIIPEFCSLKLRRQLAWLETNFPKLHQKGIFMEDLNGGVKLNARALHQGVFASMIDKSVDNITNKIHQTLGRDDAEGGPVDVPFRISRKMNPPSINITIQLKHEVHQNFMKEGLLGQSSTVSEIDVDIVPGLVIRTDQVPDPSDSSKTMGCPVYAVFKWKEESSVGPEIFGGSPNLIWRVCSSGYEKHTLDLARCSERLRYFITALRLLKTFFSKTKTDAKAARQPPPQFTTVLRSYHLKHIAFYLILYLGYEFDEVAVSGVEDALGYFISLLNISLEMGKLPHFFHSNRQITAMYPTYPVNIRQLRFNLLNGKPMDALSQAKRSLDSVLLPAIRSPEWDQNSLNLRQVKDRFRENISYGEFFRS